MRIGPKIAVLAVGATLLATTALMWIGIRNARAQYLAGVDRQLVAAAAAVPLAIGDDYLHRAVVGRTVSSDEYESIVHRLSQLADDQAIDYLYVFVLHENEVQHVATSASQAERKDSSWATFLKPYAEPPASLLQTFADGNTRFAEYADEFGSFRSIFVRHQGASAATSYVIGVDVSLGQIRSDLLALFWRFVIAGGLVVLAAGVACVLLARNIVRPLRTLDDEVEAWASREFANDEGIRSTLGHIATRQQDEVGILARGFLDVQDRLQTYLQELTRTTKQKQHFEHQLEIAKLIQESLLPAAMPAATNFQIAGWCQPAEETGGDYFDWIEMPDGKVMLTIGDVTGHGIGPALVTAASRAYGRATLNPNEALDELVTRLNTLLHTDLKGERFVTLIAGLLDPESRLLKIIAAGHGPIIFYSKRRDALTVLEESQGVPLGIMDGATYDAPIDLRFEAGDVLVLVSDGFLDWMNPAGDTFGSERLCDSVLASCRTNPDQIVDRLRADVATFSEGRPQGDDTTALVVRCLS